MNEWWKLPDSVKYAELMFAHHVAEGRFEDALLDAANDENVASYERISGDGYDNSIEFKMAHPDMRLSERQQKLIHDSGFRRCWICHSDSWETYYAWGEVFATLTGSRNLRK